VSQERIRCNYLELIAEPANKIGVEQACIEKSMMGEVLIHKFASWRSEEPFPDWRVERPLWPLSDRWGEHIAYRGAKNIFFSESSHLVRGRKRRKKLYDVMIEEWNPCLDTFRHRCSIAEEKNPRRKASSLLKRKGGIEGVEAVKVHRQEITEPFRGFFDWAHPAPVDTKQPFSLNPDRCPHVIPRRQDSTEGALNSLRVSLILEHS
jgi:hypothetical protein